MIKKIYSVYIKTMVRFLTFSLHMVVIIRILYL